MKKPFLPLLGLVALALACNTGESKREPDVQPSVGRTQGNSAEEGVADSTREFSTPTRNLTTDTSYSE
jgi:hypothetical protein